MAKYKVAEGKSLVAKGRVYVSGEEMDESCFFSKDTITQLLERKSILEVSEKKPKGKNAKSEKEEGLTE